LAVVACSLVPVSGPTFRVDNGSNTPAAIHVNGAWSGTYAPGASGDVALSGRGAPPYGITVVSPNGTVLMELTLTAEDLRAAEAGDGGIRVGSDLPCGTVRLSFAFGPPEAIEPVPAGLPPCP
jgi:hypothetical protein